MYTTATLRILATVLFAFSFSAHAECLFPKAKAGVPDGKTATEEEMRAAMAAFKAYNEEVAAFGECLKEEGKQRVSGTTQLLQLKTMQAKKLNAALDDLQVKAKQFNEQIRIFKARG